jgi:hypothetical protein
LTNGEDANLLGEAFIEAGPDLALTFAGGLFGHGANSIERAQWCQATPLDTTHCHMITLSQLRTYMQMQRLNIQLPKTLKAKLDAERKRGTSAAGLIRHLLEQHFKGKKAA